MTSWIQPPERSRFRSFLTGACGLFLAVLVLAGYNASRDLARLKAREGQLEGRTVDARARIEALERRIERVRTDPATLERLAREDLGFARSGELVLLVPDSPVSENRPGSEPASEAASSAEAPVPEARTPNAADRAGGV